MPGSANNGPADTAAHPGVERRGLPQQVPSRYRSIGMLSASRRDEAAPVDPAKSHETTCTKSSARLTRSAQFRLRQVHVENLLWRAAVPIANLCVRGRSGNPAGAREGGGYLRAGPAIRFGRRRAEELQRSTRPARGVRGEVLPSGVAPPRAGHAQKEGRPTPVARRRPITPGSRLDRQGNMAIWFAV